MLSLGRGRPPTTPHAEDDEHHAQNAASLIVREQQRIQVVRLAADIIIYWYRKKRGKKMSWRQSHMDPYKMMIEFRRLKHASSVEVEDCAGTGDKIDQ